MTCLRKNGRGHFYGDGSDPGLASPEGPGSRTWPGLSQNDSFLGQKWLKKRHFTGPGWVYKWFIVETL